MSRGIETVLTPPAPNPTHRSALSNVLTLATAGWLFAAGLIMICFPIQSARDQSPATLAIYFGGEGESPGLFYDRDFDFPTGYDYIDIPIWLLDLLLIGSSAALLVILSLATPRTDEQPVRGTV
jgi:hypothetical protein